MVFSSFFHGKKNTQIIKKKEEKGVYFEAPTSATTLKLILPCVSMFLSLSQSFELLKLSLALAMEVSAKGGGWGGVCRMREVSGLVGRRAVGRLWVGRSFPKKKLGGQRWGEKKSDKKIVPRKKTTKLGKKNLTGEKRTRRKIINTDKVN
jgi:hypothetical protein